MGRARFAYVITSISLLLSSATAVIGQPITGVEEEAISSAVNDLALVCIASAGDKTTAESTLAEMNEYAEISPGMASNASGKAIFILAGPADAFNCIFAYDSKVGAEDTSVSAHVERMLATLEIIKSDLAMQLGVSENDFVEEAGTLTYTSEELQILILPRSSIRIAVSYPN